MRSMESIGKLRILIFLSVIRLFYLAINESYSVTEMSVHCDQMTRALYFRTMIEKIPTVRRLRDVTVGGDAPGNPHVAPNC